MYAIYPFPRPQRLIVPALIAATFLLPSAVLRAEDTLRFQGTVYSAPETFKYQASIPEGTDLSELSPKAEEISHTVRSPEDGEAELVAVSDFHALIPYSLEEVVPVFTAHGREDEIYPRITNDRDLSPQRGPLEPHFQELTTSFKFLGIGATYHYILYRIPEYLNEREFLITETMVTSLDGKFTHLHVSWYLKEVMREGEPHTYLRNRVETGFVDPPPATRTIMSMFGAGDVKRFFTAVADAAGEGF